MHTMIIHGRQPALGRAELESLYGADKIKPAGDNASLLDVPQKEVNFTRLGGFVRFCQVLTVLDTTNWDDVEQYLIDTVPAHLGYLEPGKLRLGLSAYGIKTTPKKIIQTGKKLKKLIVETGRPCRYVPNTKNELNSAQVLHNKLTGKNGWEIVFLRDGNKTIAGLSIAVQDIEKYAARDQKRPCRDARVGMLPPKLAQIIINLATGPTNRQNDHGLDAALGSSEERTSRIGNTVSERKSVTDTAMRREHQRVAGSAREQVGAPMVVLDPFCGTGVILQEALLMGYGALGSDIDQRMVECSAKNLGWLERKFNLIGPICAHSEQADATQNTWQHKFSAVASEIYLGKPLSTLPDQELLQKIIGECDEICQKFLKNLARQTKAGFRLCLAVPAWKTKSGFRHLSVLDSLEKLGYNRLSLVHAKDVDLIYHRPGQIVGRELIILERK